MANAANSCRRLLLTLDGCEVNAVCLLNYTKYIHTYIHTYIQTYTAALMFYITENNRLRSHLYNKRRDVCLFVCLFVCHDLCSVWPAKRLGRSTPNLTHALMSTQGVFLARSVSRSFTYACWTDRSTKHPQSDTWRTMVTLRPDNGGGDT